MMNRVVFELIYWQLMPQKCHKYVEGGTAPKEVWFYARNMSTQFIFFKQRQKPCQLKCYDRPTWTLVSQTYARMSISLSNRTSSKVSSRQIDVTSDVRQHCNMKCECINPWNPTPEQWQSIMRIWATTPWGSWHLLPRHPSNPAIAPGRRSHRPQRSHGWWCTLTLPANQPERPWRSSSQPKNPFGHWFGVQLKS